MAARRTGVIHAWDADAPAPGDFDLGGGPVPVVVRDPLTRAILGRGSVASAEVRDGRLWADIDWPEEVERLAGASTPAARCRFDAAGRLSRVVVELDDFDPDEPMPGAEAYPPDRETETQPGDPRAERRGDDGHQPQGKASPIMAADERDRDDQQHQLHQPPRKEGRPAPAAPAGEGDQDERARELAELRDQVAERDRRIKEVNRKAAEDRKWREEREAEEARRKEEQVPEPEREKKARLEAERLRLESERRAEAAERALDELKLERQVEAEARKFKGGVGFANPELVFRLIDRSRVELDAETGQWSGVKEAVERLANDYPNLVAQKRPGPGSPPRDEFPGNAPPHGRRGAPRQAEPADAFQAVTAAMAGSYERM